MSYTLTASGWPRPRTDSTSSTPKLPVPWVAAMESLGEMNEGRRLATVGGAICNVCGEGYPDGDDAYGFSSFTFNGGDTTRSEFPLQHGDQLDELPGVDGEDWLTFLDGAVMHWRCARLAAALCPHIVRRNDLVCIRVPANDANEPCQIDGKLTLNYSAKDCYFVPWPTTLPA